MSTLTAPYAQVGVAIRNEEEYNQFLKLVGGKFKIVYDDFTNTNPRNWTCNACGNPAKEHDENGVCPDEE